MPPSALGTATFPAASVPIRLLRTVTLVPLICMPARLPEITLEVITSSKPSARTPMPLPTPVVPDASVPIRLPATKVWNASDVRDTPASTLLEMTLASASRKPPTSMPSPFTSTPTALGPGVVPSKPTPMKLP